MLYYLFFFIFFLIELKLTDAKPFTQCPGFIKKNKKCAYKLTIN